MYAINALSVGKPGNTAGREEDARIVRSGQLRYGSASAALQANYQASAPRLVKRADELFADGPKLRRRQ